VNKNSIEEITFCFFSFLITSYEKKKIEIMKGRAVFETLKGILHP
jgi:hypothetical protein